MIMLLLNTARKSHRSEANLFRSADINLKEVKCAFFDVDGTLYPPISSKRLACAALHLADRVLEGDKRNAFWSAYNSLYQEFVSAGAHVYGNFSTGNLVTDPEIIFAGNGSMQKLEDLGVLFKLAFVRADMRVGKADLLLHNARLAVLRERGATIEMVNDRVPQLLDHLRGAKKFVLSNSPEITVEGVLNLLRIREVFDGIYGSCKKPLGLGVVIDHILDAEKLEPSDALYVGDSYGVEIAVARAIGIPSIYVSKHASEYMLRELVAETSHPALVVSRTINDACAYLGRR